MLVEAVGRVVGKKKRKAGMSQRREFQTDESCKNCLVLL